MIQILENVHLVVDDVLLSLDLLLEDDLYRDLYRRLVGRPHCLLDFAECAFVCMTGKPAQIRYDHSCQGTSSGRDDPGAFPMDVCLLGCGGARILPPSTARRLNRGGLGRERGGYVAEARMCAKRPTCAQNPAELVVLLELVALGLDGRACHIWSIRA